MLETARKTRALRELRSLCREVAAGDPEAFGELVAIGVKLEEWTRAAANELREEGGYSWAALAAPLGRTRATVQQRYALRPTDGARIALPDQER